VHQWRQSTGPAQVAAAWVPYPEPPAPAPGQQPWVASQAMLNIDCPPADDGCPTTGSFVYGEPGGPSAYPASYNSIFKGTLLYSAPQETEGGVAPVITSWLSANPAGSWFGFGGQPYTVSGQQYTPTVVQIPAGDIWVNFTYYQEPPPPQVTAPVTGSVQATATPTLTAAIADTDICQDTDQPPTTEPGGGTVSCDRVRLPGFYVAAVWLGSGCRGFGVDTAALHHRYRQFVREQWMSVYAHSSVVAGAARRAAERDDLLRPGARYRLDAEPRRS